MSGTYVVRIAGSSRNMRVTLGVESHVWSKRTFILYVLLLYVRMKTYRRDVVTIKGYLLCHTGDGHG